MSLFPVLFTVLLSNVLSLTFFEGTEATQSVSGVLHSSCGDSVSDDSSLESLFEDAVKTACDSRCGDGYCCVRLPIACFVTDSKWNDTCEAVWACAKKSLIMSSPIFNNSVVSSNCSINANNGNGNGNDNGNGNGNDPLGKYLSIVPCNQTKRLLLSKGAYLDCPTMETCPHGHQVDSWPCPICYNNESMPVGVLFVPYGINSGGSRIIFTFTDA